MDFCRSAPDFIRCDLCKTDVVQMLCEICHVNLCVTCVGKHVFDDYDKHKVVPFKERNSTLIYPKCTTHPTKSCDLQCKECNIPVCSLCSESKQHEEHDLLDLSKIYVAKKESIENDETELENYISPMYKTMVIDIEAQMTRLDGDYEKLAEFVTKRGEQWQRLIERVINEMKEEINDMKSRHQGILKQQLDEIEMIQSLIDQTLLNLKKIKESNEVSMALDYTSKIKEFSRPPPKVQVSLPTFSPQYINRDEVNKLFGSLSPLLTKLEGDGYRLHKPEASVKELLEEPRLVSTIGTGYTNLCSVTCISEGEIWTSARDSDLMKCFNIQGTLKKTIRTKSRKFPSDITLTSDGNIMYSDLRTKTVNKMKDKNIKEAIRLHGWIPDNLCATSSGDMLVTMHSKDETQSKVVRYSGSTEKQTIQFDDEGKLLYSGSNCTKYISENINLDICVADYGAGAVVVVNQAGKLMFRYTGHSSTSEKQLFKPRGITTNSHYQILASDDENHSIHILDQDGHFLRFIDNCDLKIPYGLCVDKSDTSYLLVAENYTGNVKKIKYLK